MMPTAQDSDRTKELLDERIYCKVDRVLEAFVGHRRRGAVLPMTAHASIVETFIWIPGAENAAYTTTPSGMLQLTLRSWGLTGTSTPPNYGPYFSGPTGSAATANITAFSYTDANGVSVNLSNVTSRTLGNPVTTTWQ